jgi:hypothetical protein
MATYSEYWSNSAYGPGDTAAKYDLLSARSPNRYHLMRLLRKAGMRQTGEVLSTLLTDSTPATTASVTTSQLTAEADTTANVQGGVRTVAAKEKMSLVLDADMDDASANTARAVSAADVTTLQTELIPSGAQSNRQPTTYPTDASGNGGGGKLD